MLSFSLHNHAPVRLSAMLLVMTLLSLPCQRSMAGFVLSTTIDGSVGTFQVVTGEQSIDIPVYLVQTNLEDRLNIVGLFAAGASVQIQPGGGNATYLPGSAQVSAHWAAAPIAEFQTNSVLLQGLMEDTPLFATNNAIQIGSFRVVGGDAGTTTALTISLQGLVSDPILLDDFTAIMEGADDPNRITFANATIQNITAVPEPSSIALCLVALGLFLPCRRKKLPKQCEPSALAAGFEGVDYHDESSI